MPSDATTRITISGRARLCSATTSRADQVIDDLAFGSSARSARSRRLLLALRARRRHDPARSFSLDRLDVEAAVDEREVTLVERARLVGVHRDLAGQRLGAA